MHKTLPLDMKLQLFAEDGAGGDDNGGGAGTENKPELMSFDDYLSAGGQSEFDRRVQKAVNTAVTKAQEKWTALQDEKLSEAEKLAKMTQAEKAQYMAQKREKELADREAAITKRELQAEAKNTLTSKGLPIELADVLVYTDADACNASIEAVEKAFTAAVQAAVNEKLKGDAPKKAPEGAKLYTAEELRAMSPAEINANWEAVSASMALIK